MRSGRRCRVGPLRKGTYVRANLSDNVFTLYTYEVLSPSRLRSHYVPDSQGRRDQRVDGSGEKSLADVGPRTDTENSTRYMCVCVDLDKNKRDVDEPDDIRQFKKKDP